MAQVFVRRPLQIRTSARFRSAWWVDGLVFLTFIGLAYGVVSAASRFSRPLTPAETIELAERLQEEMTIAEGRQLLGRLWAARGLHADSAREFENALSLLKRLGVSERLIECYARYAAVLEAHGETGRALDCLKEAMALARPQLSLRAREPGPIMASTTS